MEIQRPRSVQSFLEKFEILTKARVPIVVTRTREPITALTSLHSYIKAEGQNRKMKCWSVLRGWGELPDDGASVVPKTADNNIEIIAALKQIALPNNPEGVYAMMYPHNHLVNGGKAANMGAVQLLKEYAIDLTRTKKTIVLIAPPAFTLPAELEDDAVILDLDPPAPTELHEIFRSVMDDGIPAEKRPVFATEDVQRFLALGSGMTANEFRSAISRVLVANRALLPNLPADEVSAALGLIKAEIVKRSNILALQPRVKMTEVGGVRHLKAWADERRDCFTPEARAAGVDAPKGVVLVGPSGSGKSYAAKAIADSLGVPLIRFDVSAVFDKFVGSSEERMQQALQMLEHLAPCAVLFDEIDKSFRNDASAGDSGTSVRVMGSLLTWMQDSTAPVFRIATANDVRRMPPEMLRRGRFDRTFCVDLPGRAERRQVLEIHLRKRNEDPAAIADLDLAVEGSKGYVPAEIEAAVKDAKVRAFRLKTPVTGQMIVDELKTMPPSSVAFAETTAALRAWARTNATPAGDSDDETAAPAAGAPDGLGLDV